jgi:hypothetical protein
MKTGRKIAIILGAGISLKECWGSFQFLKNCELEIKVLGIYVKNENGITSKIQRLLTKLSAENVDTVIIGAHNARYLSSYCDDFFRCSLHNTKATIIEVNFGYEKNTLTDLAAKIPQQIIFGNGSVIFNGAEGLMDACIYAVDADFPEIKLYEPEKTITYTLDKALEIASR